MQSVFLACVPHLSTQSASLSEANLKNVLNSTSVQISGKAMNSTVLIQLCSSQFGAGGDAATEGQCCSSAGATQCTMENRSSGSSMYVPHAMFSVYSVISQHPGRQHDIDHFSWLSTCSCARSFFSLAILILSRIFPVTSDSTADEASWQMPLQIQTVSPWHSVSLWTQSL